MLSVLRTIGWTFMHSFRKRDTIPYPEEQPYLPPRDRGGIVLTRDPDAAERCVACNLCAAARPVDCISLQKPEDETGRWYPEHFRINFSRCIYCGWCEAACPTYAIQLIPDFEMSEFDRQEMVYEKEDLLTSGVGKRPGYNFYRVARKAVGGKGKGAAENELRPKARRTLMPYAALPATQGEPVTIASYIAAIIAVIATARVITHTNAVHALLYLVLSLLGVAVAFYTLGAPFAAALEVIV